MFVVVIPVLVLLIFIWVPFLIWGIKRVRSKRHDGLGIILIIFSSLYGSLALIFGGFISLAVYHSYQYMNIKEFDPATYKGEMGELAFNWSGASNIMLKKGTGNPLKASSPDGKFKLPVGDYSLIYLNLSKNVVGKGSYSAYIYPAFNNNKMTVSKDVVAKTPVIGPPFSATVTHTNENDKDVFNLTVLDSAGNKAVIYPPSIRKPSFDLVNEKGDKVWSNKFEYG